MLLVVSFECGQLNAVAEGIPRVHAEVALERHLTRSGYDVLSCDSAEQALARIWKTTAIRGLVAIAFGVAAARKADAVAAAVHGGDHFIYPDCRPGFINAFQQMQNHALEGYADVTLYTPYINVSKADIVADGAKHDTPFAETWSCYKGGTRHCGRCGTCVERREAFHLAGVADPTEYEDPDFWVAATRAFSAEEVR